MRPLTARISSAALAHNLAVARKCAGSAKLISVIKANAYGHGLEFAAQALAQTDAYAVLTLDDAARLRTHGITKSILLLEGPFDAEDAANIAGLDLMTVVHTRQQLDWLARNSKPVPVFLKFNSGMNRLGFPLQEFESVLAAARNNPGVGDITFMTHFATADEALGVDWQWQRFKQQVRQAQFPLSAANSAAILRYPETHADWVRPGIMLYGSSPFVELSAAQLDLKPAMTLESAIIAVQDIKPGAGVGYGLNFMADTAMRVGIVACGYADGYPRHAPTGTPVLVNGHKTRTLGRVSMDMLAVDLSGLPWTGIGSPVVLWGAGLPVDEVARAAGTISYELLCALAPRVRVVRQ